MMIIGGGGFYSGSGNMSDLDKLPWSVDLESTASADMKVSNGDYVQRVKGHLMMKTDGKSVLKSDKISPTHMLNYGDNGVPAQLAVIDPVKNTLVTAYELLDVKFWSALKNADIDAVTTKIAEVEATAKRTEKSMEDVAAFYQQRDQQQEQQRTKKPEKPLKKAVNAMLALFKSSQPELHVATPLLMTYNEQEKKAFDYFPG